MMKDSKNISEAIRDIPLFSQLDATQRSLISQVASVETIAKGGLYFSEKSASRGLHVLLSGRVKLFKTSEDGKEQTIYLFGPGEPFCLCSVFSDGQLPANLAALEPSRVLVIAPEHFERIISEDPSLLLNLLRVMSVRLKEAMDMIDALSLKQAPARLAAYFLTHAHDGIVRLGITQREFAKVIGITPEALSRTLKRMSETGLIKHGDQSIQLRDIRQLEAYRDGFLGGE